MLKLYSCTSELYSFGYIAKKQNSPRRHKRLWAALANDSTMTIGVDRFAPAPETPPRALPAPLRRFHRSRLFERARASRAVQIAGAGEKARQRRRDGCLNKNVSAEKTAA